MTQEALAAGVEVELLVVEVDSDFVLDEEEDEELSLDDEELDEDELADSLPLLAARLSVR